MTAGTPASPVCTPGHTSTLIGKGTAMARERKPRPGCRTPRPSRRPPIRHRRACRKAQTRTASRGSTLSTDAPVPLWRECWRVGRAISRPDSAGSARGLPRRPTPTPQDAEPQGIALRAAVLSCRRSAMMRAKVSVSASFRMRPQGPPKFQAIRGSGSPSDRRNPRSFPAADSPLRRHIPEDRHVPGRTRHASITSHHAAAGPGPAQRIPVAPRLLSHRRRRSDETPSGRTASPPEHAPDAARRTCRHKPSTRSQRHAPMTIRLPAGSPLSSQQPSNRQSAAKAPTRVRGAPGRAPGPSRHGRGSRIRGAVPPGRTARGLAARYRARARPWQCLPRRSGPRCEGLPAVSASCSWR